MKQFMFLLMLVIAIYTAYAYVCKPGFKETLNIRVLTEKNKLVEGATVSATYQYRYEKYITKKRITDKKGMVHIPIYNSEGSPDRVYCNISITAEYMGTKKETTVMALQHADPIDIKLNLYTLKIIAVDEDGNKIPDADVFVDGKEAKKVGSINVILVPPGNREILVKYMGGKYGKSILVKNDTTVEVELKSYDINIHLYDDSGKPINNATVLVNGLQCGLNNSGACYLSNLQDEIVNVKVRYKGLEKEAKVDLERSNEYTVYIDTTPPVIGKPKAEIKGNTIIITVPIKDPNKYNSGVVNVVMKYTAGADKTYKNANTYVKNFGYYAGEIPLLKGNQTIGLKIYATDGDGNTNVKTFKISIKEEHVQTDHESEDNGIIGMITNNIIYIGIIFIILSIYLIYRNTKKDEEE